MSFSLRPSLQPAILLMAIHLALVGNARPDSSGYIHSGTREWKDDAGRVIKRVDSQGRMFLFTWDEAGRLVRIAGVAGRFNPRTPDGRAPGGEEWVHSFFYGYGPRGLVGEIDCRGERHEYLEPRDFNLKGWTDHRHVAEALAEISATLK